MTTERTALVTYAEEKFNEWKEARKDQESTWTKAHYNTLGVYSSGVQGQVRTSESNLPEGEQYFRKATGQKVNGAMAQIYGAVSSPEFALAVEDMEILGKPTLLRKLAKVIPALSKAAEAAEQAKVKDAEKILEATQREMDEWYELIDLGSLLSEFAYDAIVYGTGIIRSPKTEENVNPGYTTGGQPWVIRGPGKEVIDCWRFYPDPLAKTCQDGMGWVILHQFTASELRRNAKALGWDDTAVSEMLEEGPKGEEESWEATKRGAEKKTTSSKDDRYRVREFWGLAKVEDLKEAGVKIPDESEVGHPVTDDDFIECCIVTDGERLLKAVANPFYPAPYRPATRFQWIMAPGCFWGKGVPETSEDVQRALNSAHRAFLKAVGYCTLPMWEIDVGAAEVGQDFTKLLPGKPWIKKAGAGPIFTPVSIDYGAVTVAQNAVVFYEQQMTLNSGITEESTGIPSAHQAKTATQSAIMEGNLNESISEKLKRLDKNFEEIVRWDYGWMVKVGGATPIPMTISVSGTRRAREANAIRAKQFNDLFAILPATMNLPAQLPPGAALAGLNVGEVMKQYVTDVLEIKDAWEDTNDAAGPGQTGAGNPLGIQGGGISPMGMPPGMVPGGGAQGDGMPPVGGIPQGGPNAGSDPRITGTGISA